MSAMTARQPTCPPRYVLFGNVRYIMSRGRHPLPHPTRASEAKDVSPYGRAMQGIWNSYFGLAHGVYAAAGECGNEWLQKRLKRALREKCQILIQEDRNSGRG